MVARLAAVAGIALAMAGGPWGATGVAQGGPEPQQPAPPVFRGGVNFVSVDAFPRRDGKVVEGLTKDDFEISEDGKPQKIETLEFVHIASNPVDADRRDPNTPADADRQAADPHNRVFVVYLDLAHTTVVGSHDARRPVVDFLKRTIGASDLFGMMTAETPVSQLTFGRRTESIEGQLADYWTWGQADRGVVPRTAYEQRLETCGVLLGNPALGDELVQIGREDALQTSLESLVARLRDLREERTNVLFISEGWNPAGPHRELTANGTGDIPSIGIGTTPMNRGGAGMQPASGGELAWCNQEMGRLGAMDFAQRFHAFLTAASRANVSFYPIDVGGLKTLAPTSVSNDNLEAPFAGNVAMRGSLDTLRTLAENTDGFAVINTNDLEAGVKRISDDLASYYVLGYYSSNAAHDGRFRRIDVKVKAPRVTVSARRGYYAATAEMAAAREVAAIPAVIEEEIGRLGRLRPDADLFTFGAPTATGVAVAVELSSRASSADRWHAGGAVKVTVSAADGASATADGTIAAGARGALVQVPIDPAHRGPWTVDVVATGGDRLQDESHVDPVQAAIVGAPMAWRATPSPRSPLLPLADFQLTRGERLHVEWPMIAAPATSSVRLLDRRGQALGQPLPLATPPADRHVLVLDLPMSSLPEGDFLIDLTATAASGASERRVLGFRVVR